jgi:hypothetical protein
MRTNQKSFFKAKPGGRTALSCSSDNTVYYSFTVRLSNAAAGFPPHFDRVCVARITGFRRAKSTVKPEADHQRFLNAKCRY